MSEFLLTPSARLSHEIEVKKSRFLALVARVSTPAEAREVVNERKAAMPDARHHCAAFVVSADGAQPFSHSSDDGEPSGTAGRPMLDVLAGSKLVDVVAVVTRYFGGTLLGTGGLVRAYSATTCPRGPWPSPTPTPAATFPSWPESARASSPRTRREGSASSSPTPTPTPSPAFSPGCPRGAFGPNPREQEPSRRRRAQSATALRFAEGNCSTKG